MNYACPQCGVIFGRENGYFTGAMLVSYALAVPLLGLLTVATQLLTGWRFDLVLLVAGLYFLPFVPAIFRYSRVIWMHSDRVVDPTLESERYLERQATILRPHDLADDAAPRPDSAA
jgi:hypothetical protein